MGRLFTPMTRVKKKFFAVTALVVAGVFLTLPIFLSVTALAGGGVRGGVVHGQSDRDGAYPLEGRAEPQDMAATIFHCLGYAPETLVYDRLKRPIMIANGRPIEEIL